MFNRVSTELWNSKAVGQCRIAPPAFCRNSSRHRVLTQPFQASNLDTALDMVGEKMASNSVTLWGSCRSGFKPRIIGNWERVWRPLNWGCYKNQRGGFEPGEWSGPPAKELLHVGRPAPARDPLPLLRQRDVEVRKLLRRGRNFSVRDIDGSLQRRSRFSWFDAYRAKPAAVPYLTHKFLYNHRCQAVIELAPPCSCYTTESLQCRTMMGPR